MNSKLISPRFLVLCGMIAAAALTRFIPHLPNFTAVGAMALFGGAYFANKKVAFAVPLIAMFITDLFLGFHSTIIAVYLAFALIVVIGMTMVQKKNVSNVLIASIVASVSFFVITNFAFCRRVRRRNLLHPAADGTFARRTAWRRGRRGAVEGGRIDTAQTRYGGLRRV